MNLNDVLSPIIEKMPAFPSWNKMILTSRKSTVTDPCSSIWSGSCLTWFYSLLIEIDRQISKHWNCAVFMLHKIIQIFLLFFFLCSSVVQHLRPAVRLGDYRYPQYLKELAKQRLEDSEYLSPNARQKLPSVKWENWRQWRVGYRISKWSSLERNVCSAICVSRNLLHCSLKMRNYSHRFHLLLHLEEIQMEVDIRKYDLCNQTMTQDQSNRKLLKLRVRTSQSEYI